MPLNSDSCSRRPKNEGYVEGCSFRYSYWGIVPECCHCGEWLTEDLRVLFTVCNGG